MLKLNIGHSRKIGEANFGSRGVSVNVEMEVESDLVSRPDELKERIRRLFQLANESVAEELNGNHGDEKPALIQTSPTTNGDSNGASVHHTNGYATNNGNGQHVPRSPRLATASQLRAVRAIASQHRLDLPGILRQRFNVDLEEQLSIASASQLIDYLKSEAGLVVR